MSYLAMSAATIENDNVSSQPSDTIINKKRQTHTKTQKFKQNVNDFNPQKVNTVLESIHNNIDDDSELGNYRGLAVNESAKHSENFKPLNPFDFPDKPVSMGAERKKMEGMTSGVPQPVDNDDLKLQEIQSNYMNESQVRDYYKKLFQNNNYVNTNQSINYNQQKSNYNQQSNYNNQPNFMNDTNQVLIEKLNYMIHLLEEQQDQKTGNATEEVVLYSFLGVFIIFIVDSFTKVGKYVR